MKQLFTILILFIVYTSVLLSQVEVSSRLQSAISNANPDDYIRVLVLLRDQVDVVALDEKYYREFATIQQRASELINSLQEKARTTQVNILSYLEEKSIEVPVNLMLDLWLKDLQWDLVESNPEFPMTGKQHKHQLAQFHMYYLLQPFQDL